MNGDGIQDIVLLQRGDIVYWPGRGYGSFGTDCKYTEKELDKEIGLVYFGARCRRAPARGS